MIEIKNVTKTFDSLDALDKICFNIPKGSVYGLVGSNGSGKSTLLRIMSGVFEPDGGEVRIDGERVFENERVKGKCIFVPDFPYFYNNSTVENTAQLYRKIYPDWSEERFADLCHMFPINKKSKIISMSKGMQRQAALILALSAQPDYIFLDEIFDGLDPVVRQLVKRLIADDVYSRKMTAVIASHNLRELEDLCDYVGLLHRGKIILNKELDNVKQGIHKIQIAFKNAFENNPFEDLNLVKCEQKGNLYNIVIKGEESEYLDYLQSLEPVFMESLPLTLEEIFISEMEVAGYDINNIL
ncbi:MAG: ABC transporter ATP-binding protein [Acutalibacteraceae bacterium]